ncbi:uncharacterized protein LAJ45_02580 [Morchella importuna]|uniref:uncharacterized protein n=1 Tax=Morchella importuna TaxID=1174673 RepID=UPI001E8DA12E|nr:uncharacterized protein LAJ45_02580 [Morchella importuna]KAH8152993.1 hypothetical protein LAJ45_02580 [Morchella importuna]
MLLSSTITADKLGDDNQSHAADERPHPSRAWGVGTSEPLALPSCYEQAGRLSVKYSKAADQRHILLVYTGSKYTTKFEDVIGGGEGPTEIISWRWG